MSKAMTEARLGVIEYNHNDFTECYQYATVVNELLAEVRRLRECIKNAPHNDMCSFDKNANPFHDATTCDCGVGEWQREALGE